MNTIFLATLLLLAAYDLFANTFQKFLAVPGAKSILSEFKFRNNLQFQSRKKRRGRICIE